MISFRRTSSTWLNPGPALTGMVKGKHPFAEMLPHLCQASSQSRFLPYRNALTTIIFGNTVFGRIFPYGVGADTDSVVGMHHDQGEVADPQGAKRPH